MDVKKTAAQILKEVGGKYQGDVSLCDEAAFLCKGL